MTGHLHYEDVSEGTPLPTLRKDPTARQLVMYAGASGDFYEVHYDKDFALARGLPAVLVHGALKSAFLGQLVTDWIGAEGTLRKLSARYSEMDAPGSPLYAKGIVVKKSVQDGQRLVECEVWIENSRGEKTSSGRAVVSLPSRHDP